MKNYIKIKNKITSFDKKIEVSGDKSISIRCVLLASQAVGKSKIYNLLESEDVINALKSVEKFIFMFWDEYLLKSTITLIDSKTKLQEFSLKQFKELPKYVFFKKTPLFLRFFALPIYKTSLLLKNLYMPGSSGNLAVKAFRSLFNFFLRI